MQKVKNGDFVQVHYTGMLDDQSVFDSSDGRGPMEFQVGAGAIIPGFNDAVLNMAIDEEKTVTIAPEQAYGYPNEEAKRDFPTEMLGDRQVEVGEVLRLSSPHGPVSGKVIELGPEKFIVDFNHPLAGLTLTFKVKVAGISDTPTQVSGGCSCGHSPSDCGSSCG